MITITRRLAFQIRSVFRRAFGPRGLGPVLGFIADAEGLRVRAMSADAAVEYPARSEAHFARLFAVVHEYLDSLDSGKFNFRPGFSHRSLFYVRARALWLHRPIATRCGPRDTQRS